MGTPWGSGDGDGGNLIWWIGTPAGAVDVGLELIGGGCCSCSGCCGAAPGSGSSCGGCHCSQGGALVAVDGSCSGPASAAEAAMSGGCHYSQGRAVDGSCSGPASVAEAAWCGGCHGSHGGAVAAMGGAAWCGP